MTNNILSKFVDAPFELLINGEKFYLDYDLTLSQKREEPLTLKCRLHNTYLSKIGSVQVYIARVEVFSNISKLNNIVKVTDIVLNLNDTGRELSFTVTSPIPSLYSKGLNEAKLESTNIENEKLQYFPNVYASSLQKLKDLNMQIKLEDPNSTFYLSDEKAWYTSYPFPEAEILKQDGNLIKVYDIEENLNGDILTIQGVASKNITVGMQLKYTNKDELEHIYVVDAVHINVSTSYGVQAEYICNKVSSI